MERKGLSATVQSVLGSKATLFVSGALVAGLAMTMGSNSSHAPDRAPASVKVAAPAKKVAAPKKTQEKAHDEDSEVVENDDATEVVPAHEGQATSPSHDLTRHPASEAPTGSFVVRIWKAYGELFHSIGHKVNDIMRLDEENHRLSVENAELRKWGESMRFGCQAENARKSTRKIWARLSMETWDTMGRSLASIRYELPPNLLPKQLYVLGLDFFRGHEDEKVAKIFSYLTGMDDENTYKTAKNYLITGIAWYRLNHLNEADRYFGLVLKTGAKGEELKYVAQARLWMAIVAQRRHDHGAEQAILADFMDNHPRSPEAEWVNDGAPQRGIASESSQEVLETETPVEKEHEGPSHHEE